MILVFEPISTIHQFDMIIYLLKKCYKKLVWTILSKLFLIEKFLSLLIRFFKSLETLTEIVKFQ